MTARELTFTVNHKRYEGVESSIETVIDDYFDSAPPDPLHVDAEMSSLIETDSVIPYLWIARVTARWQA